MLAWTKGQCLLTICLLATAVTALASAVCVYYSCRPASEEVQPSAQQAWAEQEPLAEDSTGEAQATAGSVKAPHRENAIPRWPGTRQIGGFQAFEGATELWLFVGTTVLLQRPALASPPTEVRHLSLHTFVLTREGLKVHYEFPSDVWAAPNITTIFRLEGRFFAHTVQFPSNLDELFEWKPKDFEKLSQRETVSMVKRLRIGESYAATIERLLETSETHGFPRIAADSGVVPYDNDITSERLGLRVHIIRSEYPNKAVLKLLKQSGSPSKILLQVDPKWPKED